MTEAVTELDDVQTCHLAASLLLSYPDEVLYERLPVLREAIAATPWADDFEAAFVQLETLGLEGAREFHVAEFDISRKHAMHLSYWTDGDTRRRGEVLAQIKQVYRDSGLLVDLDGELPDHLPMVLEFAALGDVTRGRELLQRYRASLELLRLQLIQDDLPQAGILTAVCATLPGDSPASRAEVQQMVDASGGRLAGMTGEVEAVGLGPDLKLGGYGADRTSPTGGPEFLGQPQFLSQEDAR